MRSCSFSLLVLLAAPLLADDADQAVAHWTLRMGGRVVLEGSATPVISPSELPRGDYRIQVLDWVGVNGEPTDLERLSGLKALRELRLPGPLWNRNADTGKDLSREMKALAPVTTLRKITFSDHFLDKIRFRDEGLAEIRNLTDLEVLALRQASITGKTLTPFVNLETLDVTLCPVTDEGFASIAGMKHLKRLWARDTLITSEALANLAALSNLEDLDLQGTRVDDEGVARLAGLKNLRRLNLQSTDVTDAAVKTLIDLPKLEELNLYRTKVSNYGAAELKKLGKLRLLDLRYSRANAAALAGLRASLPGAEILASESGRTATAPPSANASETAIAAWVEQSGGSATLTGGHITHLSLPGASLTAPVMGVLSKLVHMTSLDLSGSDANDNTLAMLGSLPRLSSLRLGNTYVDGHGFKGWQSPLAELILIGSPISDEGAAAIAALTSLRQLSLAETDVTDSGLAALAALTNLEELDLSGTDSGDKGLGALEKFKKLRALGLRDTRLTDASLGSLASIAELEVLDLGHTRITNAGMAQIAALTHLKSLQMDYAEVDDEGLAKLVSLQNLEKLGLDSTNVTDRSVSVLKSLPKLRSLDLYHSLVTETGFAALKSALPQCELRWDKDARIPTRRRA